MIYFSAVIYVRAVKFRIGRSVLIQGGSTGFNVCVCVCVCVLEGVCGRGQVFDSQANSNIRIGTDFLKLQTERK